MQFPNHWFVYLIPGFMYLMFFFFLLPSPTRKSIRDSFRDPVGLVIVIILSAILGIVANTVIIKGVKPLAITLGWPNPQEDAIVLRLKVLTLAPTLDSWLEASYHGMLFARSIISPLFGLSALGIVAVWRKTLGKRLLIGEGIKLSAIRCIVTALLVGACVASVSQWWQLRGEYHNISASIKAQVRSTPP